MPDYFPTFLAKDPITGITTYTFKGVVTADELDLTSPEGAGATPVNSLRWLSDLNRQMAAYVSAWHLTITGGVNQVGNNLQIGVRMPVTPTDNQDYDDTLDAQLSLGTQNNSVTGKVAVLSLLAGAISKNLLSSDGSSDFVQSIGANPKLRLAVGNGSINWPGGTGVSNTINWSHGLGVAPIAHVAFMRDQSGTGVCRCWGVSFSAISVSFGFTTESGFAPGAGNNGQWCAIAIG